MRFSLNRFAIASIIVLLFLGWNSASGQGTSASLTGQVTDSSGAAVPGATITATNTDTSLAQTATSNGEGIYLIAPLPPGNYKLTIEARGFERYAQTGIVLSVSVNSTQNVTLKPGSLQETVTVYENAELINTTTAELGTTVNADGRHPAAAKRSRSFVVGLFVDRHRERRAERVRAGGQPGVQAGFSFPTETGASAGGGRQGSTEYLLDGVPNMDNYMGLTAPFPERRRYPGVSRHHQQFQR